MQPKPGPRRLMWSAFACVLLATAALLAGVVFRDYFIKELELGVLVLATALFLFVVAFRVAGRAEARVEAAFARSIEAKPPQDWRRRGVTDHRPESTPDEADPEGAEPAGRAGASAGASRD